MRTQSLCLAVAVVFCLSLAPAARAETPADLQEAHSLAVEGQREFSLGNYEVALDLLQRAYKKHPLPALLYNVAQCQRLLGHLEQARRVYKAFLDAAPDSPVASVAREKIAELEAALKAQSAAEKAAPENLTRTEKPGSEPEPVAAPASSAAPATAAAHPDDSGAGAHPAAPPLPAGLVAGSVPTVAVVSEAPPEKHGTSWGWWAAGGGAVVAVAVVVAILATSSSSKSVNEPAGSFSGR